MNKFKILFVLLLAILVVPFAVFAEGEEENNEESTETTETTEEASKKVNLYFFRGEGCSHCAEAKEWFESIQEELGEYFTIVDYETWYSEENSDLMAKVAEARGETADGVPYIICGDKSWMGFADDYKEEIKEQIKSEYAKNVSDRYDIMKLMSSGKSAKKTEDSSGSDVLALLLIIVVCFGIGFGIHTARKKTN